MDSNFRVNKFYVFIYLYCFCFLFLFLLFLFVCLFLGGWGAAGCSKNWFSPDYLQLTCFRQGFIAQLVEHRTGIADVMGLNPVGASEFFLGFICNFLSYFITGKISLSFILYPQFTHMIFLICNSQYKIR